MLNRLFAWLINRIHDLKDIALVFLSKSLTAFTVMIIMISFARSFGAEGSGVLAMILLIPGVAFSFGSLGMDTSNTYFLANKQSNPKEILGNTLIQSLFMSFLAIAAILLLFRANPSIIGELSFSYLVVALLIVPIFFVERLLQSILIGIQRFDLFSFPLLISKFIILFIVVTSIFVLKFDLLASTIIFAAALLILPVWYLAVLIKKYSFCFRFDWSLFKKTFFFAFKAYIIALLCFLILRSDLFVLNLFRGVREVGLYSVATNFFDAINLITASLALVLLPKMASLKQDGYKILNSGLKITFALVFPALLLVLLLSKPLIIVLFGSQFISAVQPFILLGVALIFWSLTTIINQYFSSIGIPFYLIFLWLGGLMLNISLNIIYIPNYGMIAAATSSLVTYFLLFVVSWVLVKINIKNNRVLIFTKNLI